MGYITSERIIKKTLEEKLPGLVLKPGAVRQGGCIHDDLTSLLDLVYVSFDSQTLKLISPR